MVYEYLDHTSDVYVHSRSENLSGLFEDAAKATFEVMLNTSVVRGRKAIEVGIKADDLEQLLYKWVDHLLYLFDAKSFAISRAEVIIVADGESPSLKAKIFGESYDPSKHGQKVAVKAMTYSLMRIQKSEGAWEAYFVIDI